LPFIDASATLATLLAIIDAIDYAIIDIDYSLLIRHYFRH
jgi:hypothetical protein